MPKKIEVAIQLKDGISKPIDKVRGAVKRFSDDLNKSFSRLINFRNTAIVAGLVFVGKQFIDAAAKIEVFAKQLEIVSGSAGEAKQALAAIREFARTSPLETEDVVKSFVRLRAVGIDPTMKQMRTIGGVAVLMNREMADVLDAFIGLNKRTLRTLGIDIDRTGAKAIIQSGNVRREVAKDTASIRGALLEIWEERFPNAIETAADTFTSQMSIMRSNIFEFSARLGKQFLPQIKNMVKKFSEFVEKGQSQIKNIIITVSILSASIRTVFNSMQIVMDTVILQYFIVGHVAVGAFKAIVEAVKLAINSIKSLAKALLNLRKGKFLETLKEEFEDFSFDPILNEFKNGITNAMSMGNVWVDSTKNNINDIVNAWKTVGEKIREPITFDKPGELPGSGKLGTGESGAGDAKKLLRKEVWLLKERLKANEMFQEAIIGGMKTSGERQLALIDQEEGTKLSKIKSWYELGVIEEQRYQDMKTAIQAESARKRDEIEKAHLNSIVDANMTFGKTISDLAKQGIQESKKNAGKKKTQLKGLALIDAAAAAVTGFRTAMDSGIPWPGNLVAAITTVGTVIASTAGQIANINRQKFARGTPYAPGGLSLVGEEGPELVNLPRGAQVFTNRQSNSILNGGINLNVTVNGNASDNTVAKIGNVLQDFGRNFSAALRYGHIDPIREGFKMA